MSDDFTVYDTFQDCVSISEFAFKLSVTDKMFYDNIVEAQGLTRDLTNIPITVRVPYDQNFSKGPRSVTSSTRYL
ncbi:hypothetical protein GRS66_007331 [Saccharomyces pastorianus]|uniref:Uncharacterized protein n=1 Tax=Saccharomyces pastorianus TaxID=27292 RepID=A0A6C1E768_SACPS|nr:hypothetical protein GRS66_007331 [Saccharomyces pastorianus]